MDDCVSSEVAEFVVMLENNGLTRQGRACNKVGSSTRKSLARRQTELDFWGNVNKEATKRLWMIKGHKTPVVQATRIIHASLENGLPLSVFLKIVKK